MTTPCVVVVGDAMLDVVTRPLESLALTSDTAASTHLGRGGSGANIAVAIASHGVDVTYVACVGDDTSGRMFADDLIQHGVRPRLQQDLARAGYTVRVYVPFGSDWYPYLMRRLAERPANVGFVVRNLARR